MLKFKLGIGIAIALMLAAVPAPAVGHNLDTSDRPKTEVMDDTGGVERSTPIPVKEMKTQLKPPSLKEEAKAWVSKRLDSSQRRRCQARYHVIDGLTKSSTERAQRRRQYFDAVVSRVEEFVSRHRLEIEGYEHLLADVESSRAAVLESYARAENARTLNCDGEDPRGEVETFKATVKDLIGALKNYRDDIKVMVRAVHQAAKEGQL